MDLDPAIFAQYLLKPDMPVHVITGNVRGSAPIVYQAAQQDGLEVYVVDGAGVKDENDLFRVLATAMSFPDYFGNNWDALDECLCDLDWLSATGYVVLYEWPRALIEESPSDFATFLDIMVAVSRHWWKYHQVVFRLVLLDSIPLSRLEDIGSRSYCIQEWKYVEPALR